jgi:hypothetical protein
MTVAFPCCPVTLFFSMRIFLPMNYYSSPRWLRLGLWLALLLPLPLRAQVEAGLSFMPALYQRTFTNPAWQQSARWQLFLPQVSGAGGHSGFSLADALVDPQASPWVLAPEQLLRQLGEQNRLEAGLRVEPLGASLRLGPWQLGLHTALQVHGLVDYPAALPALLWRGNAAYLGETVEIGPAVQGLAYRELAVSVSRPVTSWLQAGIRLRYLNGLVAVATPRHHLSLYTHPEYYDLTLETDYELQLATAFSLDYDSLLQGGNPGAAPRPGDLFNFGRNPGLAVDLGVVLKPRENFEVGISVLNLGQINWSYAPYEVRSQGSFTFSGWEIDMQDSVSWEGWEADVEGLLDSLEATLSPGGQASPFSTSLPGSLLLTAQYQPLSWVRVGMSWQASRYLARWQQQTSLFAGVEWPKWGSVGVTYGYHSSWRHQLGAQARVNLGPVQLYALSGNLLALLQPIRAQGVSARLGMNLTFGQGQPTAQRAGR